LTERAFRMRNPIRRRRVYSLDILFPPTVFGAFFTPFFLGAIGL
jgi:hypothetical protein